MSPRISFLRIALPLSALAACVAKEPRKEGISDTTDVAPVVAAMAVNHGSHGMSERISWIFSGDGKAVLVIADPSGAEADPVPNGFVFGDETSGFQAQMDSVWDVAVSPDWKSIAFSKAFVVADGSGQVDPAYLSDLARRTSIDTAAIRTSSFPSSGMSGARAIAQIGLIRIPSDPRNPSAGDSAAPKMFPVARGWRVRWISDGSAIALGSVPGRALDAEPSETWTALDPRTGQFHTSLPATARIVEPRMSVGPVLHSASGPDLSSAPPIKAMRDGRELTIVSERGVITIAVKIPGDTAAVTPHVIGPGIALAATAGGGFIIAIAPKAKIEAGEPPVEAVVYRVIW